MRWTMLSFTLSVLTLVVIGADDQLAFAQQKRTVPPAASRPPDPGASSRWKLQEDTQTRIFSINQDVQQNRAKTTDKSFNHGDSYIRGDRSSRFNLKNLPGMRWSR